MLEWLKTILGDTYTEEIDKKVSDEIGKGFVSRADFNQVNEAKKTLDGQVKDRDAQLETLKKASGNNEELKKQINDLQEANKTAKADYDANLKKLTVSGKIESALLAAKVRSTKAARALLDETKISLDGENLLGLNDQIEALKKDSAYLFEDGGAGGGNPPAPGGGNPPSPDDKLSDADYYAKVFDKKK